MSVSTSRRAVAAAPGAQLMGTGGRGDVPDGGDSPWAGPVDQHACFDLTEGSAPPPGAPPAPDDDSVCGTPGASRPPVAAPVQTRG